jgi:tripartite-type tricarboxylate transporter receptor subunit TctC
VLAAALFTPATAAAQSWPAKPIRFMIVQAPGGQNDVQARLIGPRLSEALGQPIIYDNRPGAGGALGFELFAQTPPDGYTIAMGSISTLAVIPMMPRKPRYDALGDFVPVTLVTTSPNTVVVHPSVPATTLKGLVALAKAKPGALTYGTPGIATGIHLNTEMFRVAAGIDLVHVPYKGGAPATVDLLAGQIALMFNNPVTTLPHVKTGRLRALAITSAKRSHALPDVPTMKEYGYEGFESGSWQGIVVRAGTPQSIVTRLHTELVKVLHTPEVRNWNVNQGNEVIANSPQEFAAFIRQEMGKWAKVIKSAGVRND